MQVVSFLKAPFPSTNGTGFQGGAVINELVSLIDYAPTILAAGGISPPDAMRGRPLQALVEGRTQDWPQKVFLQISESQVGRAIGTSKWKYSVRAPGKNREHHSSSDVYCEDYLYDLEHDPRELHNLVSASAAKTRRCHQEETTGMVVRRMKISEVPYVLILLTRIPVVS